MASQEPLMGSVDLWPLNWAPVGWLICNGQFLSVNQYNALYSLLGNTYGGSSPTTFGIPDMRGRVPVGMGQGSYQGATNYVLGTTGGVEQVILTSAQGPLAAHTHPSTYTDPNFRANATGTVSLKAFDGAGQINTPGGYFLANSPGGDGYNDSSNAALAPSDVSVTVNVTKSSAGSVTVGANAAVSAAQAHENRMPYTVLNYMIAVEGIYPQRP